MKKRILITGSEGLIGKIISRDLRTDYRVFTLDRIHRNRKYSNHFVCDITCEKEVEAVFRKISPIDAIIHLAADSQVRAVWGSVLSNNIVGTRNIYEGARMMKVKRVIFASSNHATGAYEDVSQRHSEKNTPILTVGDPVRPDGYYGVSKIFGEALARMFFDRFNIESICLRFGSVLIDDDPHGDSRLIKTWLSHRDLAQLIRKSLSASVRFGIYYGVSANSGRFWDIKSTCRDLGYKPLDNAFLKKVT